FELCSNGFSCWRMDLTIALKKLPAPVFLPPLDMLTGDVIINMAKSVYKNAVRSPRLYLLHGHQEPLADGEFSTSTLAMRYYLELVTVQKHRHAITRLSIGGHILASETLRYARVCVPPEERLCRFCRILPETPEHAILGCVAHPELLVLRTQVLNDIAKWFDVLNLLQMNSAIDVLKTIIFDQQSICTVAKFVYEVFQSFRTVPLPWPT
ncbi:hypothetical protein C8J56DRAFT_785034, partial [Mycena floridula]